MVGMGGARRRGPFLVGLDRRMRDDARYDIGDFLAPAVATSVEICVDRRLMTACVENMNYSAAGLLANFLNEFDEAEALQYANKPPMIAIYGRPGRGRRGR